MTTVDSTRSASAGAGLVLFTLATGQFLMTLDSSVMNVLIAQVAKDVGTTVTGVQTAITLYTLVMATLMIPGVVTFVPLFVLVANAGLIDSLPGLFLPFLVTPFGVFLMRQFILGLPKDLLDAGRVDGAGELRIFARIILPLCGPALATLGILTFLGSWNNFLWPLVVAQTEDTYTLPVALALYSKGQNSTNYGLLLAGATVVLLPVLAVFLAFQRRVIEGIATTGIK